MNQKEVKVMFYLKKSETNDAGRCPVMAQLSIGKYAEVAFSAKMTCAGIVVVVGTCCREKSGGC